MLLNYLFSSFFFEFLHIEGSFYNAKDISLKILNDEKNYVVSRIQLNLKEDNNSKIYVRFDECKISFMKNFCTNFNYDDEISDVINCPTEPYEFSKIYLEIQQEYYYSKNCCHL